MKPLLFVTGHAPAYRVGALARLHEREGIELALFGGRYKHGGAGFEGEMPFPHRHVRPRELYALAAGGGYRAVVCPTGGRLAPLATWAGARRARVPLILWASLWAHPRSAAHALSYLPLRRLYRSADAVVTYGPHVSAYVRRARRAQRVRRAAVGRQRLLERTRRLRRRAARAWPARRRRALLVRRARRAARRAWRCWSRRGAWPRWRRRRNALVLVGTGLGPRGVRAGGPAPPRRRGHRLAGPARAGELRDMYAACDVLVVPSIPTRTFREPWGAGGQRGDEPRPGGDRLRRRRRSRGRTGARRRQRPRRARGRQRARWRRRCERLAGDGALRARLGERAATDVRAYSHDAWAQGFCEALASLGLARGRW